MFNIKKQINLLYITSIISNLSITGAWVAILAARGFSLVQIGFAETIFHITSLIFEIPSGILADVYGRKNMLLVSQIMALAGNIIMALSGGIEMVCLSMIFVALSFNFASGSGDALAYDSLKSVKQEAKYERYASNQTIIYRIGNGISTLCAGLALFMGYRLAYLLSAVSHLITLLLTCKLTEIRIVSTKKEHSEITKRKSKEKMHVLSKILKNCGHRFTESILFLKQNLKAAKLMFANSLVGTMDILLLFFLQAKLPEAGISKWTLGIALFVMELGGILGAKLILKAKKIRYRKIFMICTCIVLSGIYLEHTGVIILMVLGGILSAMADDALQIRTDAKLQEMFSSENRATLLSMSSFTFSVIMIVLSPLAGFFFSIW